MQSVLALWTVWIPVAIVVPAILLVIGIGVMYLKKVVAPQYPNRR